MTITRVQNNSDQRAGGANNDNIFFDSNVAVGNLIIACWNAGEAVTSFPAGWTEVVHPSRTGTRMYYRIAASAATDMGNWAMAGNNQLAWTVAEYNSTYGWPDDPLDGWEDDPEDFNVTSAPAADTDVTPSQDSALMYAFFALRDHTFDTTKSYASATYTHVDHVCSQSGQAFSKEACTAELILTSGGASNTTISHDTADNAGMLFAFIDNAVPTYDANSQGDDTATDTLTVSHTVTVNDDTALFVLVSSFTSGVGNIPTCTYNSVSMTEIANSVFGAGNDEMVTLFGLLSPTEGSAQNIVASFASAEDEVVLVASSYYNVGGWGTASVFTTDNVAEATHAISSASGDTVLSAMSVYNKAVTDGAGQTRRVTNDNGATLDSAYMADEPGDTSVTMSWDFSPNGYPGVVSLNLEFPSEATNTYKPTGVNLLKRSPLVRM